MKGLEQINGKAAQKGQSLIEYTLLVAIILGMLMIFLRPGGFLTLEFTNIAEQQGQLLVNRTIEILR